MYAGRFLDLVRDMSWGDALRLAFRCEPPVTKKEYSQALYLALSSRAPVYFVHQMFVQGGELPAPRAGEQVKDTPGGRALAGWLQHEAAHCSPDQEQPLIHQAATQLDAAVVSLMLQCGAGIETPDSHGFTPLFDAAVNNRLETLRLLIAAGADVHHVGPRGQTTLHYARSEEGIRLLLQAGVAIDKQDDFGQTPLHSAIAVESQERAACLLRAGADPDIRDRDGRNFLFASLAFPRYADIMLHHLATTSCDFYAHSPAGRTFLEEVDAKARGAADERQEQLAAVRETYSRIVADRAAHRAAGLALPETALRPAPRL